MGAGEEKIKEGKVEWIQCNFENLKEVNKVAKELKSKLPRLDLVSPFYSFIDYSSPIDIHVIVLRNSR